MMTKEPSISSSRDRKACMRKQPYLTHTLHTPFIRLQGCQQSTDLQLQGLTGRACRGTRHIQQ